MTAVGGRGEVIDVVVSLSENASQVQPGEHVTIPVAAGQPDVLADGQGDRTTSGPELGGKLHTRRRHAHHQHAAVGQ